MGRQRSPIRAGWAKALRSAKDRLGLTTKVVASQSGVAPGTVVKILQGNSGILLRHIEAVAKALRLQSNMQFTPSQDGKERATIRISLRLSREELEEIKEAAKTDGENWREWMENKAALAIETALVDGGGEYEQHYGKGESNGET